MKNVKSNAKLLFNSMLSKLEVVYEKNEALAISKLYFSDVLNLSYAQIIAEKEFEFDIDKLENDNQRLVNQEPIQYVVEKCEFLDLVFFVNKHTLIPRPETEELVLKISKDLQNSLKTKLLDIGSGCGCIPISLKNKNPSWQISGLDISKEAIEMAKKNANINQSEIDFFQYDILDNNLKLERKFNCIVSNPPYVLESEKAQMSKNVLNFEPYSALFVPDNDALLFYKAILKFSHTNLEKNGRIYFEINPLKSTEMKNLLSEFNYSNIESIKDFNNKIRFVTGIKS